VTLEWTPEERTQVEAGIARYPAESGRCAALARIIYRLALPKDKQTRGIQLSGAHQARWLILKRDRPRQWKTHTLVETARHDADALTGPDGCPTEQYLERHFQFPEAIAVRDVDVFTVDPWIEEEEKRRGRIP
jgi:hypothetical protein